MYKVIATKLLYLAFMLFIISIISFVAIHLSPNSFFASGELNPNITPESIAQLESIYGLDKPLYIQFISWFRAILSLDFGISFASGAQVKDEILSRIGITLTINIISMVLIFVLSFYLGVKSALNQGKLIDNIVSQFAIFSFSVPSFYLGLIFIYIFSIYLELLPLAGTSSDDTLAGLDYIADTAKHLVMPISIMVIGGFGTMAIYIRQLTLKILGQDYIYFAKTRQLTTSQIMRKYIVPNLYPPVITMLGLSLPGIIGGSVILETIFSIDGMGLLFFQSALSRDYPVIMGILIVGAFLTILGNILADIWLLKLNPFAKF